MSTSIGIPIDRIGSRGFGAARRGRMGGNLAKNKGGGWVEVVLSSTEEQSAIQTKRPYWRDMPGQFSMLLYTTC